MNSSQNLGHLDRNINSKSKYDWILKRKMALYEAGGIGFNLLTISPTSMEAGRVLSVVNMQ